MQHGAVSSLRNATSVPSGENPGAVSVSDPPTIEPTIAGHWIADVDVAVGLVSG